MDDAARTDGYETLREPLPPTPPGETRLWCSCDTGRKHPYYSSAALLAHINEARAAHQPAPEGSQP